ncbi:DEAD/DEAH box helicase [Crocosphaera sp. Alani8]|uniref:DEAD/DEAH box helicase n=1 Tax=Crocosphaera sp. Alani8 TaxID=3038952 RepID=UPI00313EF2E2
MTHNSNPIEEFFKSSNIPFESRGLFYLCQIDERYFYYSHQTGKWRLKGERVWSKSENLTGFLQQARHYSQTQTPSLSTSNHQQLKKQVPDVTTISNPNSHPYPLRDYQVQLIQEIYQHWKNGQTKVLAQLPTGAGKTICFAAIASEFACRGEKVIILAHREELVLQAADKLRTVTGQQVGIIKAKYKPNYSLIVQVASVLSLVRRQSVIDKVGLIIIDEAHHSTAKTYRQIIERYPDAYQLGVTATPIRLDGVGFRDLFDELVCGLTIKELIQQKYLSRFRLYADPNPMSTKGVRMAQGDFSVKGLEKANNLIQLSGQLIESYRKQAPGLRCLVFAINVNHSQLIAERYNQAGIPARHLDGTTPTPLRQDILEQFRRGDILVLTNCQLFDEGLDIPALEAVQVAKPTKSLTKWLQMVGRVLRPQENKDYALILDHTKNWAIHGLPTRERIWTLDGVEDTKKSQTKRDSHGVVTEEEITVTETDTPLTHIDETLEPQTTSTPIAPSPSQKMINLFEKMAESNPPTSTPSPELSQWEKNYYYLLSEQRQNDYSVGWIYYRLKEVNPPLSIWQKYAQLRGYHPKWANHQFESLNPPSPLSPEILQQIWQLALQELPLLSQSLFNIHSQLSALHTPWATVSISSKNLLKVFHSREYEIVSALTRVFQHPIRVQFFVDPSVRTPRRILNLPPVDNQKEFDF